MRNELQIKYPVKKTWQFGQLFNQEIVCWHLLAFHLSVFMWNQKYKIICPHSPKNPYTYQKVRQVKLPQKFFEIRTFTVNSWSTMKKFIEYYEEPSLVHLYFFEICHFKSYPSEIYKTNYNSTNTCGKSFILYIDVYTFTHTETYKAMHLYIENIFTIFHNINLTLCIYHIYFSLLNVPTFL